MISSSYSREHNGSCRQRQHFQNIPQGYLCGGRINNNDITRLKLWIVSLPRLDCIEIKPGGRACTTDRSEYDDIARGRIDVDPASHRQHLNERGSAFQAVNAGGFYRTLDCNALAVRLFDTNCNLR